MAYIYMKSLNFHVCHILPPYEKACPHALKPYLPCAPTCGSPPHEGTYISQNNQSPIGTGRHIQIVQITNIVKRRIYIFLPTG